MIFATAVCVAAQVLGGLLAAQPQPWRWRPPKEAVATIHREREKH